MQTETQQFNSKDGTSIFYRVVRTDSAVANPQSAAVLVVQHGYGEHSGRYQHLIEGLKDQALVIYLVDSRGHGNSGGKRGVARPFEQFVEDLDQLVDIAIKKEKVSQVNLLGHSMGAVVSATYAENEARQKKIKSWVLSALAMRVKPDLMMKIKKLAAPLLAAIAPDLTLPAGLNVNFLSHDEKEVKAYQNDPLVHGDISGYLGQYMLNAETHLLPDAGNITIPTYMFHGREDQIADCSGTEVFYERLGSSDKKIKIFERLYHETMNEREVDRVQVVREVADWLKGHAF